MAIIHAKSRSGKQGIAAVKIDGDAMLNGYQVDAQAVTTIHGRSNTIKLLHESIEAENKGETSLYFWDKKEAVALIVRSGLQLPGSVPQNGFVHSILEESSPVKPKFEDQTQTRQFKRWFGESKVVMPDGTPKILYHQTNAEFTVFDTQKQGAGYNDSEMPSGIYMKETPETIKLGTDFENSRQMPLHVRMVMLLYLQDREQANKYWQRHVPGYAKMQKELDELNARYEAVYDEADRLWEGDTDEDWDKWDAETDRVMEEWKTAENGKRRQMKEAIDAWLEDRFFQPSFALVHRLSASFRQLDAAGGSSVRNCLIFCRERRGLHAPLYYATIKKDKTQAGAAARGRDKGMKFALIADVHGNLPALEAVLADARAQGAQGVLLAGDYIISAPWPVETAERLMRLENARFVCGNEERYLHVPDGDDGQFAVSRFCRDALGPERIAFFDAMPAQLEFKACGVRVHMAHSSEEFIGDAETGPFATRMLPVRYGDRVVPRERLLGDIRAHLEKDGRSQRLSPGVYIFGHTHSQWHARFGNVLLVNPGSCGLPLDCGEAGAAYSLLTLEDGRAQVEERRVPCDIEAVIRYASETEMYAAARVWCEVIFREWRMRRENMMYFLNFTERFARGIGDGRRPFAADTWEAAHNAWTQAGSPIVTERDL